MKWTDNPWKCTVNSQRFSVILGLVRTQHKNHGHSTGKSLGTFPKRRRTEWEAMGAMYAISWRCLGDIKYGQIDSNSVLWGEFYERKQKRAANGELVSQILVAASDDWFKVPVDVANTSRTGQSSLMVLRSKLHCFHNRQLQEVLSFLDIRWYQ